LITKERVLNFDSPFLSAKLAGYKRSPAHGHQQADTDQESKPRPYPSGGHSCLFSLLMMKFQGMQCTILNKKELIFYFVGAAKTLSWHLSSENSTKANTHKPTFS
jgi:hypothetical protein